MSEANIQVEIKSTSNLPELPMGVQVAQETYRRITEHPDTYMQEVWFEVYDEDGEVEVEVWPSTWQTILQYPADVTEWCGTKACAAGHSLAAAKHLGFDPVAEVCERFPEHLRQRPARIVEAGAAVLELEKPQANWLFFHTTNELARLTIKHLGRGMRFQDAKTLALEEVSGYGPMRSYYT